MTELTDLLSKPPASRTCRFGDWVAGLSDEEAVSVYDALDNPEWTATKLTAVFKKFGMPSDDKVVRLHRKRECDICGSVGSA